MAITHVVHFGYAPEVAEEEKRKAADIMLALKNNCVKKDTKKPYIVSIIGGANNSPEGSAGGLEVCLLLQAGNRNVAPYLIRLLCTSGF